ncbi:hypothetical protein K438DRAFT_1587216, partial [Mycena galopus ATCC 62051]
MAVSNLTEDDIEFDELDEEELEWDKCADVPSRLRLDVSDTDAVPRGRRDDEEAEEPIVGTSLTSENLVTAAVTTAPEFELEIYDSGATQHMTPSRHRLTNYRAIQPRGILAADSKKFEAIGMGDMCVQVPNGNK